MKTTNNMLKGGSLLPEYAAAWATYFTKFIQAYEQEGIPIWAITVQNEEKCSSKKFVHIAAIPHSFLG